MKLEHIQFIHWLCLFAGVVAFYLIKLLQKYQEAKSKGSVFIWSAYTFSIETIVPVLLTIIFGFFYMVLITAELPDRPNWTAVSTGGMATAGYAVFRSFIMSRSASNQGNK